VLNCNTYDVGLHAAVELGADKLFCLHLSDVDGLHLPPWLPLSDARSMLLNRMMGHVSIAVGGNSVTGRSSSCKVLVT
jgi:amino-acid N-acetyltransferase